MATVVEMITIGADVSASLLQEIVIETLHGANYEVLQGDFAFVTLPEYQAEIIKRALDMREVDWGHAPA
jgi:ribose 5-phosphate isomerase RpiB